jgi:hypothetical protein
VRRAAGSCRRTLCWALLAVRPAYHWCPPKYIAVGRTRKMKLALLAVPVGPRDYIRSTTPSGWGPGLGWILCVLLKLGRGERSGPSQVNRRKMPFSSVGLKQEEERRDSKSDLDEHASDHFINCY